MTKLKWISDYQKMDEISWMKVGRVYVYVIIDWIGGSINYKVTRKQMETFIAKYDFEYNKFCAAFEHAYSCSKITFGTN